MIVLSIKKSIIVVGKSFGFAFIGILKITVTIQVSKGSHTHTHTSWLAEYFTFFINKKPFLTTRRDRLDCRINFNNRSNCSVNRQPRWFAELRVISFSPTSEAKYRS